MIASIVACTSPKQATPPAEVWHAPPPDSELSQIQAGMSQQRVMEILGPPTEITNNSRVAAASADGSPEPRTYYIYPGLGEVVFSSAAGGATAALGVYSVPSAGNAP